MASLQRVQFLNLLILTGLGSYSAFIYLDPVKIALLLLFGMGLEHLLIYLRYGRIRHFSFSALSTTLGVVLMMVSVEYWIYLFAVGAGLLQKHFLRYRDRHIFNPSNFAIVATMLLFYRQAHTVLGQLGDSYVLMSVVLLLGAAVLIRAGRGLIPPAFVAVYLTLQYLLIVQTDPVLFMEDVVLRFYSVSFIVFILFMLTDPQTTPGGLLGELLFAAAVAGLSTLLDYAVGFRVQHLFLALFAVSAARPLFDGSAGEDTKSHIVKWVVFFLSIVTIMIIELRPPYYFAMDV